jgi:hypothetical protein
VSQRHHLAGDLEAWNVGRAFRRRIGALALAHVGTIDAGRRDLDQDLARLRRRHRAILGHQHLRPAGGFDSDHGFVRHAKVIGNIPLRPQIAHRQARQDAL